MTSWGNERVYYYDNLLAKGSIYGDGHQLKVVVLQNVVNYCLSVLHGDNNESLQEMIVVVILFQGRILSSGDVLHKK